MRAAKALLALGLLGFAAPAWAQDGSPWGESKPEEPEPSEEGAGEGVEQERTVSRSGARTEDEAEQTDDELAEEGAAIDRIEIALDPETSPPGGLVKVSVQFLTEDGKRVPGVVFDLLAKDGDAGEVDEDAGRFTATFEVSRYAEDEAKISVITDAGLHEMAKIEIEGDPVERAVATDARQPEPEEEPEEEEVAAAPEEEPKPPKEPRQPVDVDPIWLHVQAGGAGGFYGYAQTPDADDSGPLIEDELAFGNGNGAGARAAGGSIGATVWVPDLEYLGFQGHLRFLAYSVESGAFDGTAADWLYDGGLFAIGRYPVDIDGGRVWAGGRLGFTYDDFLVFEGCLDPGCQVDFSTISTPGLGIGPRAGLEMGPVLGEIGYTGGLAAGSRPYRNAFDLEVGARVADPLTVEASLDIIGRAISLANDGGDVRGTIRDNQTVIGLGLGAVF